MKTYTMKLKERLCTFTTVAKNHSQAKQEFIDCLMEIDFDDIEITEFEAEENVYIPASLNDKILKANFIRENNLVSQKDIERVTYERKPSH